MSKNTLEHRRLKFFVLSLFASSWAVANITGTVYQDYNLNGTQDAGEVGVSGMQINAVCEDGSTPSATTAANGSYTLTVATAGDKCRIEADPSSAGLGSGANAQGSAPLVDIVTDGATHNISVSSPSSYCQSNPDVAVAATPVNSSATAHTSLFSIYSDFSNGALYPIQSNGYPDASSGVSTPVLATNQPQVKIDNAYTNRVALTDSTKTGGIWGLAWDRSNKKLYAGAVIRRYVNLIDNNGDGVGDVGAIYRIDPVANTTSLLVDISEAYGGYNVQESTRDLLQSNQQDSAVVPYVGRAGLGDVDISEDGNTLYTVSLGSKELVSIPLVNPNSYTLTPIPNPYGASCPAGDVRPWATKVRGSDIYIGSVCESDMTVGAAVQKYDGTNFTTVTIGNKLNYDKNGATGPTFVNGNNAYKPWSVTNRQAPIFSDIEFDNNGDMILGFIDRKSYIADSFNAVSGDIRRMCYSPGQGNNGSDYVDESTSSDPTSCASSTTHYSDPTSFGAPFDYPEYYSGDYMGENFVSHVENTIGGLAMKTGDNGVYSTAFDPTSVYNSGFTKFDNATGFKIGSQMITPSSERDIYARKAGGLGDIELLCDPAPIEIGNYVWEDMNGDGIQDPEEPAIANVPVTLTCNGTAYGTATTDANGHYYFGGISNVGLTGGNTLTRGLNCVLSIAQSDVANRPATTQDANGNASDTIDSDAVNNGSNMEISFITAAGNNHDLDFGISSVVGCVAGTLFQDNNGDTVLDGGDTVAPAGITVKATSSTGSVLTATTDSSGAYTFASLPVGNYTISVELSDTDIPQGAVWTSSTSTVAVVQGTPPTCSLAPFPYTLPAPTDQDPKDVATCANPTSLTWDGSTVSSQTVWQNLLTAPLTATTVGGVTVGVNMSINNPDNKFYDTDLANTSGSGTSAAFGQPYLTLYLGDQNAPGDGNFNSPGNCAAHGYQLEAGQKAELVVEFAQEVILDNWRIRDVDSGDIRGGNPNWNWQDGIKVEGFDANNNPVTIEPKIGSAGAGLIKDANDIVHTDATTYNSGDVAHGAGSTPNATNGHIVLTSNFIPVKKLIITHSAGPDVPCQTRSALAMAGLAVCAPLHISGTIFDDKDGVAPSGTCGTSNNTVDGVGVNSVDGVALNACLLDTSGVVVDTQAVDASGNYDFDKYIHPNTNYKVLLTKENCTIGSIAPSAALPQGWYNEGEQIDPANNTGHDGTADGMIAVAVANSDITDVDFAINKVPTATGYTRPSEVNPNNTTALTFDLSASASSVYTADFEETTPTLFKITSIFGGTLYNGGTQLNVGDTFTDFSVLTINPDNGDTVAVFKYVAVDKACRESNKALFSAPFTTLNISGNLFLDSTRDNQVNGIPVQNSCDGTTQLYANLIDSSGNVLAANALDSAGSFFFGASDGISPNTDYTVVLSQVEGTIGNPAPSAVLPAGCSHLDGENIESLNPAITDGTPDGIISVSVGTSDVININFAITPSVKIGDKVWIEDDNDGDATTGTITPVVGTTVTAICDSNAYTAVTDSNGIYGILVPQNSDCIISVPTPMGSRPTAGSGENKSITDTTTGNNKSHDNKGTSMKVGTVDNLTADFGFTTPQTAHIGDYFWIDKNANGVQETGEKPVIGAIIELFDAQGNPLTDIHGNHSVTTDANGKYGFDVDPGTYQVKFNLPKTGYEGYVFSNANQGDDKADTDVNRQGFTQKLTVTAGDNIVTLDAGINCGCANVSTDSADAQSPVSMLAMMLFTLMLALYFVRREEIQ